MSENAELDTARAEIAYLLRMRLYRAIPELWTAKDIFRPLILPSILGSNHPCVMTPSPPACYHDESLDITPGEFTHGPLAGQGALRMTQWDHHVESDDRPRLTHYEFSQSLHSREFHKPTTHRGIYDDDPPQHDPPRGRHDGGRHDGQTDLE